MVEHALKERANCRKKRKWRVRSLIHGTQDRPRLTIFRSNRHIYLQIIDDDQGVTLAAATTQMDLFRSLKKNKSSAYTLGKHLGEVAIQKSIASVVFDRGFYKFHGIVAECAKGARSAGLKF